MDDPTTTEKAKAIPADSPEGRAFAAAWSIVSIDLVRGLATLGNGGLMPVDVARLTRAIHFHAQLVAMVGKLAEAAKAYAYADDILELNALLRDAHALHAKAKG